MAVEYPNLMAAFGVITKGTDPIEGQVVGCTVKRLAVGDYRITLDGPTGAVLCGMGGSQSGLTVHPFPIDATGINFGVEDTAGDPVDGPFSFAVFEISPSAVRQL